MGAPLQSFLGTPHQESAEASFYMLPHGEVYQSFPSTPQTLNWDCGQVNGGFAQMQETKVLCLSDLLPADLGRQPPLSLPRRQVVAKTHSAEVPVSQRAGEQEAALSHVVKTPDESEMLLTGTCEHSSTCKPCYYFHRGGCEVGASCKFCHICQYAKRDEA